MQHLVQSVERSLLSGNPYAALSTALALPDICGWLINPSSGSKDRYVAWFDRYLADKYVHHVGRSKTRTVFLTGNDCYALRCAFLHEGREDITEQRARQLIEKFQFVVAPQGWVVHCNLMNDTLQLQVDVFCTEVLDGVHRFQVDYAPYADIVKRMSALLRIHDVSGNVIA